MAAVAATIADAGHAPERVVNDYGEDLLVQTSHAGRMDASRLWFQVKGTVEIERFTLKRGGFSIPVDLDHELRWSRSADLVVIVLWDVEENVGWFALPDAGRVDPREVLDVGQHKRSVRLSEKNALTPSAVDRLAWESRLEHYRLLVLSARDQEAIRNLELDEEGSRDPQGRLPRRVHIAVDFLILLDLLERFEKSGEEAFRATSRAVERFKAHFEMDSETLERAVYGAAIQTLVWRAQEIHAGMGLPMALVNEGAETLVAAMGLTDFLDDEMGEAR